MEISESTWAFIAKHRREDVRDVALHAKHDGDVDVPFALEQIAGWQRASLKLPDWASHDGLIFPPQVPMEQCSSQFTAQYKARLAQRLLAEEAVDDDSPASLVDLTGGFGVDFSYMSRVFNRATYVEQQSILCDIARHNFPILGLDHAEVINDDSTAVLDTLGRVSMIFLDPARRDDHGSVADFAGAVHEVHIVSTGNECKELLLVLGRGRCVSPLVVCANDEQVLSYKAGDNSDNHTTISDSALAARNTCNTEDSPSEESANDFDSSHWKYLYEPNASIMKAGCFDVLEQRFAVHHISPNSHLFVAAEPIADFPGRSFAIESIATMNKKELKQLLAGLTHANIAVRNFPLTVAQLRKKLKLKDGGNTYLFATTDAQGRHLVLRTKKRKSGPL